MINSLGKFAENAWWPFDSNLRWRSFDVISLRAGLFKDLETRLDIQGRKFFQSQVWLIRCWKYNEIESAKVEPSLSLDLMKDLEHLKPLKINVMLKSARHSVNIHWNVLLRQHFHFLRIWITGLGSCSIFPVIQPASIARNNSNSITGCAYSFLVDSN